MISQRFPFQFIGNNLVLDFVNTRIVAGTQRYDLIEEPNQFAHWLKEVGIQSRIGDWFASDFTQLFSLRDAIQALVQAVINGSAADASALIQINSHLEHYAARSNLTYDRGIFRINDDQRNLKPEAVMSFLANQTALLLASTDQERIKACGGRKCVLVFKDTSKGGRRKWCSMEACGNRTKATKFRESSVGV